MAQEILKDWQQRALDYVGKHHDLDQFYLTGGTALAGYYLHHRFSDDLDFFCFHPIDSLFIQSVGSELKVILGATEARFSRLYDRHQFFYTLNGEELKVEFTYYPFRQLRPLSLFDTVRVDSEFDIAVNKLFTITERFDPKDFVDLYFLFQKYSLQELREGAQKKFGMVLDPLFLGSELAKVRRVEALPKMALPLTIEELKAAFQKTMALLESEVIDQ